MEKNDLKIVVDALDKIITSERKEVQDAFKELMIIVTLSKDSEGVNGPIKGLMSDMEKMKSDIRRMQRELSKEASFNEYRRALNSPIWDPKWSNEWLNTGPGIEDTAPSSLSTKEFKIKNTPSLSDLQDKYKSYYGGIKE